MKRQAFEYGAFLKRYSVDPLSAGTEPEPITIAAIQALDADIRQFATQHGLVVTSEHDFEANEQKTNPRPQDGVFSPGIQSFIWVYRVLHQWLDQVHVQLQRHEGSKAPADTPHRSAVEHHPLTFMAAIIKASTPVLLAITVGAFVTGLGFAGVGAYLVYKGSSGDTEISLFGQSFKSTNVGIAAIFCAVVMIVLCIRRALHTIEGLARNGKS